MALELQVDLDDIFVITVTATVEIGVIPVTWRSPSAGLGALLAVFACSVAADTTYFRQSHSFIVSSMNYVRLTFPTLLSLSSESVK